MMQDGKIPTRLIPLAAFTLVALALIAVNVLAAYLPLRADVTDEGLFTLSEGSQQIVSSLQEPTTIKLYYNAGLEELPVTLKSYSTKVIELLREYESASGGQLTVEVYDPRPDTDEEEWATRYGLSGARLPTGNTLFFGMVVLSAEREEVVPFFDPRRQKFLEYDISRALSRVNQPAKEKIGVVSALPLGGFGNPRAPGRMQGEWAFLAELRKEYEVETLDPAEMVEVPREVKLVLAIHPRDFPDSVSYALDQFLLRGGKLLVAVDPNSRLDPAAQRGMGLPTNSHLKKLFGAWGVEFTGDKVVGDLELATRVNSPQAGVVDYPIWITINPNYLNREQVLTAELEELVLIDSGAFTAAEDTGLTFTPLVRSSVNSAMVDFAGARMLGPAELARSITPDNKERVLAAILSGTFKSAFPGGAPPPPPPRPGPQGQPPGPPKKPSQPHLSEGQQETSVILIGDSDFLADQFSIQTVNFFGNQVSQPINDNLNLVLNAVEFLAGSQNLIHIRSRGQFSRKFTKVAELQLAAAGRFAEEEQRLTEQLEEVKRKLEAIEQQTPKGQKVILTPEQLDAVKAFRLEEQRTSKALKEVRKVLRQDIESLGNSLLTINLLVVPLLVGMAGFFVILTRSRRSGGKQ